MTMDFNNTPMELAVRCKTQMVTFGNLTLIGTQDDINEHEHRLKHFQVKISECLEEKIINLRVSMVGDYFFCCVVTRYSKSTFHVTKEIVDKILSGEKPVDSNMIKTLKGQ